MLDVLRDLEREHVWDLDEARRERRERLLDLVRECRGERERERLRLREREHPRERERVRDLALVPERLDRRRVSDERCLELRRGDSRSLG